MGSQKTAVTKSRNTKGKDRKMSDPHDPDNRENETRKKALMGDVKLPRPDEKTEPGGNEENEMPETVLMGDVKLPRPDEKTEPGDNEENETESGWLSGFILGPKFVANGKKKKR